MGKFRVPTIFLHRLELRRWARRKRAFAHPTPIRAGTFSTA
jgi:hypothetical protein